MMFLFGYLGSLNGAPGWPIHLMHLAETAFVVTAFVCVLLAVFLKGGARWQRDLVAFVGGVSASFGLIMPFELAPFFFDARGEIMMGTILLNLVYPFAAALFISLFSSAMSIDRKQPPPLPTTK